MLCSTGTIYFIWLCNDKIDMDFINDPREETFSSFGKDLDPRTVVQNW